MHKIAQCGLTLIFALFIYNYWVFNIYIFENIYFYSGLIKDLFIFDKDKFFLAQPYLEREYTDVELASLWDRGLKDDFGGWSKAELAWFQDTLEHISKYTILEGFNIDYSADKFQQLGYQIILDSYTTILRSNKPSLLQEFGIYLWDIYYSCLFQYWNLYGFFFNYFITTKSTSYWAAYSQQLIIEADIKYTTFLFWLQLISISIFTIWARGVGPRFRPDQMSDLTWKDMLIYTGCCLLVIIFFIFGG